MLRLVDDLNECPIIIRSTPLETRVTVIWINKNGTKAILYATKSSSVAAGRALEEERSVSKLMLKSITAVNWSQWTNLCLSHFFILAL